MPRQFFNSGSGFEADAGYSRVVVEGDTAWVAGTTGFDYATMTIDGDFAAQAHQAFRNVSTALESAGFGLHEAVRVTVYLTDGANWPIFQPIARQWLDAARPAATAVIVAGLVDPRMGIEIEVTAVRRRD